LWSKCDRGVIGGVVDIRLTRPVAFEGDVPVRGFDRLSGTAYVEGVAHVKAHGTLLLWVYVDINRRAVVGIDFWPADFSSVEKVAPRPVIERRIVRPYRPAGGPDRRRCPPSRD
jgi:hypothetical protein